MHLGGPGSTGFCTICQAASGSCQKGFHRSRPSFQARDKDVMIFGNSATAVPARRAEPPTATTSGCMRSIRGSSCDPMRLARTWIARCAGTFLPAPSSWADIAEPNRFSRGFFRRRGELSRFTPARERVCAARGGFVPHRRAPAESSRRVGHDLGAGDVASALIKLVEAGSSVFVLIWRAGDDVLLQMRDE